MKKLKFKKEYKKYKEYKDSGIDWIGEIPNGWEIKKIKFLTNRIGKSKLPASYGGNDGKYTFFTSSVKNKRCNNFLYNGEYEIVGDGGFANFEYIDGKFSYSDHCFLLKTLRKLNSKFLHYYFLANKEAINDLGFVGIGLKNIDSYFFSNLFLSFPKIINQQKIANYLDKKTELIDKTIERKKKLIKLLEEKKKAIINKAVTKGLDDSVEMKKEFLFKIPKHWCIKEIKFISKEVDTGTTPDTSIIRYFNEGVDWFTPVDFDKFELIESKRKISKYAIQDKMCKLFPKQSVLIIGIGATLGKVAYANNNFCCNQQINVLVPNSKMNYKFLFYYLYSINDLIKNLSFFTTLPILNQDRLKNIPCIIPPIKEQKKIIEYLDRKTDKFNSIIIKIKQSINLLNEYKSSLITNIVTGKIKI